MNDSFNLFAGDKEYNSGVIFYDSNSHDEEDYSYIQFNINEPSKTFPTMMSSTGFWPVNWEWYRDTFGYSDTMNTFGISSETFLSNGPQKLTSFDNLYGYETSRNENYYDSYLVPTKKTSFRMVSESATQAAMFKTGSATYVQSSDSNSKVLTQDEEIAKWMKDKFTKPATKYMFWNLGRDRFTLDSNVAEHAKYTSDPNFRRAVKYRFNTNAYHSFNGLNSATASSLFTPLGIYSDSYGNDFVNYATDTTLTTQGTEALGIDPEQLEYYASEDREKVVFNPLTNEELNEKSPTYNEKLSDYYFTIFIEDMKKLGVELPKNNEFSLKYLTSTGASDPFVKELQQDANEFHTLNSDGSIKDTYTLSIEVDTVTSGAFWDEYYAHDWDLASIQWSADYLEPWSNIGIFNYSEYSRGSNSTGSWNYWDGSDYTFIDEDYILTEEDEKGNSHNVKQVYATYDDPELARYLFNDGFAQFYETYDGSESGANSNIKNINYKKDSTSSLILDDGYTNGTKYSTDSLEISGTETPDGTISIYGNKLWEAVLSDANYEAEGTGTILESWLENRTPLADSNYTFKGTKPSSDNPLGYNTNYGLNHDGHTDDIWSEPVGMMSANLALEIILKDSGATVVGTTESKSTSPSRALLEGDPVVGYESRTFSFDLTKITDDSYWKIVEKQLFEEFNK